MPEDQACSVEPRPTEDDDLARAAVKVVQQEGAGAEGRRVLTKQRRIGTEENPSSTHGRVRTATARSTA